MFFSAPMFNQPLDNWDVSQVENTAAMFKDATSFNQALNWNLVSITDTTDMFLGSLGSIQSLSG